MLKKMLMLFVVILMSFSVFAQTNVDNSNVDNINAGITPDSLFYFLDVGLDNLKLALEFNPTEKVRKELEIVNERLAEINVMVEKKDVKGLNIAQEKHQETLDRLELDMDKIDGSSSDKLEKNKEIEKEIEEHKDKVNHIKNKVKIEIEGELTEEQKDEINKILSNIDTKKVEIKIEKEKKEIEEEKEKEEKEKEEKEKGDKNEKTNIV